MSRPINLNEAAFYSEGRINGSKVSLETYITTNNILPNKNGITISSLEPKGNLLAYEKDDILIRNIRPYLKKIWYADRKGGCSPDVLVLKTREGYDPKYIYYTLFRNDFFSHMMRGAMGTKMPRGDKNQILRFHIPDFDFDFQQKNCRHPFFLRFQNRTQQPHQC